MSTSINNPSIGELRLFHTADFHLGSPFSGLDPRASESRRREQLEIFAAAISQASESRCSAILIAGDLFDCGYVDRQTVKSVFDILGGAGMPVIIAPGNHDPMTRGGVYSAKDMPENLFIFDSPQMSYLDFPELHLRIHGYAFESERYTDDPLSSGEISVAPNSYNVLLAHADIYSPLSTYAPINLRQLESVGFDYVALGHIHKYDEPVRIGKTLVAYSGFPVGRSFDECGFGGALIVTLSPSDTLTSSADRIILSDKRYISESLDVTGVSGRNELSAAIKKYVSDRGYGRETSLRLHLTGSVDPAFHCDPLLSASDLGLALLDLRNDTLPILNVEYLENDLTLRGALYRQLSPDLNHPDPYRRKVAAEALRMGLAAIEGRAVLS